MPGTLVVRVGVGGGGRQEVHTPKCSCGYLQTRSWRRLDFCYSVLFFCTQFALLWKLGGKCYFKESHTEQHLKTYLTIKRQTDWTDDLGVPVSFSGWIMFGSKVDRDHGDPHHDRTRAEDGKGMEILAVRWWWLCPVLWSSRQPPGTSQPAGPWPPGQRIHSQECLQNWGRHACTERA